MKNISLIILLFFTVLGCNKEIEVIEVYTGSAQNITNHSAILTGDVISNGDSQISEVGICWSTISEPTILDNKNIIDSDLGSFISLLNELEAETTYYVRTYAILNSKLFYGQEVQFTTTIGPEYPIITTSIITVITSTSATTGGNITSDGGSTITERGIYWSDTSGINIEEANLISSGTGSGIFSINLTELLAETTYYVMAYATNDVGTAYGEEFSFTTNCSEVYAGNLILSTQEEINNFASTCISKIAGSLTIEETIADDIVDLTPLDALIEIGGELIITNNTNLETLNGLNNIGTVGDNLLIYNNNGLLHLDYLDNLTSVAGNLKIAGNVLLENIDGLQNITTIGSDVIIDNNEALYHLDGLSGLSSIYGKLKVTNNITLNNIDGLEWIETVSDDVSISANPMLTNLNGLSNIYHIGGSMGIYSNHSLTNLNGLESLDHITSTLNIGDNDDLISLNGLQNLESVGGFGLWIAVNESLVDFCDLSTTLLGELSTPSTYVLYENAYNPTLEDLLAGNCALSY